MGYIIEITEDKAMDMKDHAKKILKHGKELIECIEELAEGSHMGERGYGRGGRMGYREDEERDYDRMGERGGYGRYGMREDDRDYDDDRMGERYPRERWEDYPPYLNERRGRSRYTGRYVRR